MFDPIVTIPGPSPDTRGVAPLPEREIVSAEKKAKFFWSQYDQGRSLRARRDSAWLKVRLIMRGIHYFKLTGGSWRAVPPKDNEVRAYVTLMENFYRRVLGRIGSNVLGVTVSPQTGRGRNAFYMAERGQAILDGWLEEERVESIEDQANQQCLMYGGYAYHWYGDPRVGRMCLRSIPMPQIFPIPYSATTFDSADGVIVVEPVSRQWLEQEDERMARRLPPGTKFRKMADEASPMSPALMSRTPFVSSAELGGDRVDGATTLSVWMKPTPERPGGETYFMVNDTLYRQQLEKIDGVDPIPDGRLPFEPVYWRKNPDEWWPYGLCESLVAPQLEANRQFSTILRNAKFNKPFVAYDPEKIDPKSVQQSDDMWIPYVRGQYEDSNLRSGISHIPASGTARDVGTVYSIVEGMAARSADLDSPISMGQSSGRVDGGPATQILDANAQAPLQPVFARKQRAWKGVYTGVLDGLKRVWPAQKTVRIAGQRNLGREMQVAKEDVPWSREVTIRPQPFMLNGRSQMVATLFQLRSMPGPDGTPGTEVSSAEFRRSLALMDASPPGLDLFDRAEQRIAWRISQLIGDGKQPGVQPFDGSGRLVMEDHGLAQRMLKDAILDPSFEQYGPAVQQALIAELRAHAQMQNPLPPDNFDDSQQRTDSRAQESYFDGLEQSFENMDVVSASWPPGAI